MSINEPPPRRGGTHGEQRKRIVTTAFAGKSYYHANHDGNQLDGDIAGAHLSEEGTAMVAALALGGNLLQESRIGRAHKN